MPITHLSSGGIIVTYKCQASCGHCMYGCSPDFSANYITADRADSICKQLRKLGCSSLHIGGGEPFFNVENLVMLIKTMSKYNIEVDYIETNAAWVTADNARTREILHQVLEAGGNCIMVSADPFHIEFIPFWKTATLINLLRKMNIQHFIWQEKYLKLLQTLDPYKTYNNDELNEAVRFDAVSQCIREYGMGFNGRALNLLRNIAVKKPHTEFLQTAPCRSWSNTSHFHVDLNGRYTPPGCTGMSISLEHLSNELDSNEYPAISQLTTGGISALYAKASEQGFTPDENGYASRCDLCFNIRKYLAVKLPDVYSDLTPKEFYNQNY